MPRVSFKNCKRCDIELNCDNRLGNLCKKCVYKVYKRQTNEYFIEYRKKIRERKKEVGYVESTRKLTEEEIQHVKRLIVKGRIDCLTPLDFYNIAHYYLIISKVDKTDYMPVDKQVKVFLKYLEKKVC